MSAEGLRQVGNRGVWVDPAYVVAVAGHEHSVALMLATGGRLIVSRYEQAWTDHDVSAVVDELRAAAEPDPTPGDVDDVPLEVDVPLEQPA